MTPIVLPADGRSEFWTDERCFIVEWSNGENDPAVSIAQARVEPGVTTRWHHLVGTIERYVILEGEGSVEIGDLSPRRMTAGDIALIPALCRQRITNTGTTDLLFLAICSPRFAPACYVDVDPEPPA
jgi:mannose-6-phosphate isomerase-like protein (cupin superfamily)